MKTDFLTVWPCPLPPRQVSTRCPSPALPFAELCKHPLQFAVARAFWVTHFLIVWPCPLPPRPVPTTGLPQLCPLQSFISTICNLRQPATHSLFVTQKAKTDFLIVWPCPLPPRPVPTRWLSPALPFARLCKHPLQSAVTGNPHPFCSTKKRRKKTDCTGTRHKINSASLGAVFCPARCIPY